MMRRDCCTTGDDGIREGHRSGWMPVTKMHSFALLSRPPRSTGLPLMVEPDEPEAEAEAVAEAKAAPPII